MTATRAGPGSSKSRLIGVAMLIALAAGVCFIMLNRTPDVAVLARREQPLQPHGRWISLSLEVGDRMIEAKAVILAAGHYGGFLSQQTDPTASHKRLSQICEEEHPLLGVNGGYFDARFSPVGLLRIAGQPLSPLTNEPPLSAIAGFDASGRLNLLRSTEDASGMVDAVQAGPFVIDPGGGIGVAKSGPAAKRTVLALSIGGDVVVLSTSNASLYDVAIILRQSPTLFGVGAIDRAVNLDGGPSAAMCVPSLPADSQVTEAGPVRDFVLFR